MDISYFFPGVQVLRQTQHTQGLTLYLGSQTTSASCPACKTSSTRVHGYFWRYPQDLSWAGQSLRVWLRVRRFDCLNLTCSRATFCESFAQWLLPYAHRTERLKGVGAQIGVQVGGEVGALVLEKQGHPISADTVLRAIKALKLPEYSTPRVLGVDDWAFKKGRVYGTILVDLERHQVIDLLPDRSTTTLQTWLEKHPGVEIVTRDRDSDYSRAIRQAAPQAVQIADRFHLLKNLSDGVRSWLARERKRLQDVLDRLKEQFLYPTLSVSVLYTLPEETSTAIRKVRPMFEAVLALKPGKGEKMLNGKILPPRRWWTGTTSQHTPLSAIQEAHFKALLERPSQARTLETLEPEMRALGYQGSRQTLRVRLYRFDLEQGLSEPPAPKTVRSRSTYHARALTRLLTWPASRLGSEDLSFVTRLSGASPLIAGAYPLIQELHTLLGTSSSEHALGLQAWLEKASLCEVQELKVLAKGLRRDIDAVIAGVTLPWSNGQTEGQVNRLKMIKRQGYGRDGFDLLRRRVLMS